MEPIYQNNTMPTAATPNTLSAKLDAIARYLLFAVIFLLPIFILPTQWLSLPIAKVAILSFGVLVALVLWSVARLNDHEVTFPRTEVLWTSLLLLGGYVIAAVLSDTVMRSLVGFGFERDTVLVMFTLVGALAAAALTMRRVGHFIQLQKTMLASFLLVGVFQLLHVTIGFDALFPNLFSSNPTATLLGSWSDLAVFSGLALLMALAGLALFSARALIRAALYAVLVIALILLLLVNLSSVWVTLICTTLLLALYIFADASYDRNGATFKPRIPWGRLAPSAGVLLVSGVFLMGGLGIGGRIADTFGVAYIDVRPSWEGTTAIITQVYQDNAIFGVGPNSFREAWAQYRPLAVNETNFWDTDFNFGVGLIPTSFVTGGLVVGALWTLFLLAFIRLGFKILARRLESVYMYIAVSSYVGAAYLWILSIIYVPQTVMLAYAFVLTGAAVAAARVAGVVRARTTQAEEGYASGFALTAAAVVVALVSFGTLVVQAERVSTAVLLSRSVASFNDADFERAGHIADNASLFSNDTRGAQLKTNIGMAQLSRLLNEQSADIEAQRAEFQQRLSATITAARATVEADENNYRSWLLLGDVYASLVPLQIEGAYESAVDAYNQAAEKGPRNPVSFARLARLALAQDNYDAARTFAQKALELKSNFTEAHFILSQIAIREGDVQEAITSTESAVLLRPGNTGLLFQLGALYYSAGAYEDVVTVLGHAVTIDPDYANALYFLGLAYDKLGDYDKARAAFAHIAELNPDNTTVGDILGALIRGGSAFDVLGTEVRPVADSEDLPVSEE